ncbi:hypothetical protein [Parahaliea aestuarii]|uniref:CopL family metal-binding regulatory protein n=1 Tax=Parahaliea aestuarii TaxID=1852021 RepID=A0A5C9A3C7_9GAMM|nr:hypothetical protein [Parahaliea aestuarii]TXS94442.1 hypothetical protein FVW59_00540 [Parahaliea aestuarii]
MSSRISTLLTAVFFALSLLAQSGAASACEEERGADMNHHAAHAGMMEAEPAAPAGDDCCDDSEHCPMQACFTGAALPCQAELLQLPPLAALLPLAPVRHTTPACSRFERPPIFA